MTFDPPAALVWFRRDLRDYDHAALDAAADAGRVYCAFVFDREILDVLPARRDRRLHYIRESLAELDRALAARGGGLIVREGMARAEIPRLARELGVSAVFANRDYEPAAKDRDAAVAAALSECGIDFRTVKDQVLHDGDDILTGAGRPYTVFTPYGRAWRARLAAEGVAPYSREPRLVRPPSGSRIPTLDELGFAPTDLLDLGIRPGMAGARSAWDDFRPRMGDYAARRDFPGVKGVSYLSVHLRFGTLSVRELVGEALATAGVGAETWLGELAWRDFFFSILDRFPQVEKRCFRPEFDRLVWDDWPEGLAAWREGRTGYPLVDAGMRQLARSGYMHNRLRMVVASFLCKDLGIDWRHGERHFAACLNDFDLAANNGGWQWAASTGCDAQPYFRIFNPVSQSERFDPDGRFIRRYLPELARVPDRHIHAPWRMSPAEQAAAGFVLGRDYPAPLVDHAAARRRTLERYRSVRSDA